MPTWTPITAAAIAFLKICSGKFERKSITSTSAGQTTEVFSPTASWPEEIGGLDDAWPGDIVGCPIPARLKSATPLTVAKTALQGIPVSRRTVQVHREPDP
jgi:peptide subunit release factor RF-3